MIAYNDKVITKNGCWLTPRQRPASSLPPYTIRYQFDSTFDPTQYSGRGAAHWNASNWTHVADNVWDFCYPSANWHEAFLNILPSANVLDANLRDVQGLKDAKITGRNVNVGDLLSVTDANDCIIASESITVGDVHTTSTSSSTFDRFLGGNATSVSIGTCVGIPRWNSQTFLDLTKCETFVVGDMYGTPSLDLAFKHVGEDTNGKTKIFVGNLPDVESMSNLCQSNHGLKSFKCGITPKLTDVSAMFYHCDNLRQATELDTSKVTNASNMYYYCTSMTKAPAYDFSSCVDFSEAFRDCVSLREIPRFKYGDLSRANVDFMFMMDHTDGSIERGAYYLYACMTKNTNPETWNTIYGNNPPPFPPPEMATVPLGYSPAYPLGNVFNGRYLNPVERSYIPSSWWNP